MARSLVRAVGAGVLAVVIGLSAWVRAAASVSPVADAAQAENREAVRTLLKQAADVNASQADGMTALHWAAMRNDVELAKMLLYAGANVRATTRINAYTPLLLAARNGNAAVMEPLVSAGADANLATANGTTPLMLAAAAGSVDAVNLLLTHDANVNATETYRALTPIMYAAAADRTDVVALLAKHGADLRATTKVVELNKMGRNSAVFAGLFVGNPQAPGQQNGSGQRGGGSGAGAFGGRNPFAGTAGVDRQYQLNELVYAQGGMTPLLLAARQGYAATVGALLDAGADIDQVSAGDHTTPLLIATLNGHFDLAKALLDRGANPRTASENGATPLYAALNCEWAPKALYPQPRAYANQRTTYLSLMQALLDHAADPNVRLTKKVWYQGYSFDLSGIDEIGATPFWRAAYASDIDAMRLLVAHGADPRIPTIKGAGRPRIADENREVKDVASTPPVPLGGPGIPPLVAAAGAGYGEGFAANSHRFAPTGMLAAVKYLVEELGADVNAKDHEGNTALHNAAARGDVEMIKYLVSKGADVKAVNREGKTTADMANGPVQRIQPWPEALTLLESLGAINNHKCVSC